jgi:hypothetical protein
MPNASRAGRETSIEPKPLDKRLIETAVKTARRTSEVTTRPVERTDARTSTPTPALPPTPCRSPIANAPLRVGVRVRVEAELSAAPADEEAEGEVATPVAEDRDHIQGPTDAAVTLLQYGDYECPYCGAAYPIIKEVQARMGERLRFVFRNFPITTSHPHAHVHAARVREDFMSGVRGLAGSHPGGRRFESG